MARERTRHSRDRVSRKVLRRRAELLGQAAELASVGSWEIDLEKKELRWSPQFFHIVGIPPRKQPMRPDFWVSLMHPDDREAALKRVNVLQRDGTPMESEVRFMTANRGWRLFHTRSAAIRNKSGKIVRIRGMTQDVTEQREAERQLRERTATVEHAEEVAKLGSWRYDYATDSFTLSPNMRRILGIGPDDKWSSKLYWSRVPPDDRERAQAIFERATQERKPFEFVARFAPMNGGGLAHLHTRGITFCDASGKLTHRVGVVQDISDRRDAEIQLREREELLAHAEQLANMGSYRYDHGLTSVLPSANLNRIYGFAPEAQFTRAEFWDRVHPDDRGWAYKLVSESIESKQPFDFVARFLHPERGLRYLHTRGVPRLDDPSDEFRRVGVVQDITEQYEVEQKIREREALLAQAEEIANLGSWKYEFETDKLTLSPQLRKIYGLGENDEWTNDVYWSRVHPADGERVREMIERATREKSGFECLARFVPIGGEVRHMHLRAVPVLDAAGKLVRRVGIAQDITGQVRAEEELRRLSQQLMRTQDDERRHLARELHETAGQSLAALKMTLGRLRDTMGDLDDVAHALLKSASELADAGAREVRTVSYLMHPPMLDEAGLGPALRWYAPGFAERSGISVSTEIPESLPRHSRGVETTIFRIVQEALTNVHRYSHSATAQIRVWCDKGDIHAEVRDNGRGFIEKHPTSREAEALGVGIAGMRERVAQLRGLFELHSTLGEGTMLHVALPGGGQSRDSSTSSVTRMPARTSAPRKAM
jgi:PAS domain S-box-containing protein